MCSQNHARKIGQADEHDNMAAINAFFMLESAVDTLGQVLSEARPGSELIQSLIYLHRKSKLNIDAHRASVSAAQSAMLFNFPGDIALEVEP